jgi:non-specific serine/threonine protein kinase
MRKIFKQHQTNVFKWAIKKKNVALFLEMRLGKTLFAIRIVKFWNCQSVLIVCPYSCIQSWQDEIENEKLRFITITGNKKLDDIQLYFNAPYQFFIINKELYEKYDYSIYQWDCVIIDESTIIANPQANITKYFLKPIWQKAQHRIILTGTPSPENALQYYCQLKFLDVSLMPYLNYWEFRLKCFDPTYNHGYQINKLGKEVLTKALQKCAYFLNRKQCNLGGEKIYEKRYCQMPLEIRAKYNQVLDTFTIDDKKTIFATQKFIWLRKLCGGFTDEGFINRFKTLELQSILQSELQNNQVIIWANYIQEIKTIWAHYDRECKIITGNVPMTERSIIIEEFRKKKFRLLIAQPENLKFGENLSCCDTMIYFSRPLGLLTNQQTEDRNIHIEKNSSTLIIDLITEDSIEEDIYNSIKAKEQQSQMMQRILKRINKND